MVDATKIYYRLIHDKPAPFSKKSLGKIPQQLD